MPRYQIKSITLEKGNAVFLPHGIEIAADTVEEAGQKIADNLFVLAGLNVKGIQAIIKRDVEESWEAEPEKPNLFNANGGEALPKKRGRKPRMIEGTRQIEDRRTRYDGLTYE